ncbi:hypothetical protein H2200_011324 [Cladophialophora chaetospira]|uniref:Uncharacterized protein n=1 Tax=Cladophialophora chaetospira TaxID=386627 RepID=A0AA38X0E7_9EURO|nr:hypothetical protein H2200_011324 [Cladophialophora chaetospira]
MGWGRAQIADCVQPNETRIHVSIGNFLVDERWNGTGLDDYTAALPPDQMFHVVNSTNILCKPHYKVELSTVQKKIKSMSETVITSIVPIGGDGTNSTKYAIDIARGVFQAIYNTDDPTLANAGYVTNTVDSFVQLLVWGSPDSDDNAFQMDGTPSESDYWFQSDHLARKSNTLYTSVAAQMAGLKLLQPTSQSIAGDFTGELPRLMVRLLSFVIMEVCLGLLITIAAYLSVSGCDSAISHDPGSIAGMAAVLSRSDNFINLIRHSGHLKSSELEKVLSNYTYQTSLVRVAANQYTTRIHTHGPADLGPSREREPNHTSDIRWWQPLVLKPLPRVLIVVIPLVCLALLQVLLVESMSKNGLCDVSSNSWVHYGWTYIPALLMVCIRLTYDTVKFSIQTLSPYSIMRRAPTTANISVEDQPLTRIALHELFLSLRRRQLATFTSTAGALLAPLLTIAVSGLYTTENALRNVKVQQLTGWHFNVGAWPNVTLVENVFQKLNQPSPLETTWSTISGAENADLIVMANLTYPSWTYDELAFSVLEVSSLQGKDEVSLKPTEGSLQVRVPAVRGGLNCSTLAEDKINITYATKSMSLSYTDPRNTVWDLSTAGSRQEQTKIVQSDSVIVAPSTPSDVLVALISTTDGDSLNGCPLAPEIVFLPTTGGSQGFGYFSPLEFHTNDTSTHCPVYGGMFGTFDEAKLENFTWFFCSTYAEQVMVESTFVLPDYNISTAHADETTAAHVKTNATYPLGFGQGGAGDTMSLPPVISSGVNLLPAIDANAFVNFYNTSGGQNYDNFFSALIYGRDGVSAESISGQDNTHHLISAIQHLWRIIYAQHIRSIPIYWSAAPDDIKAFAPTGDWTGTFKSTSQYRLKQSIFASRFLQAVLGLLSCSAIVTFLSMETRKVLPNSPTSIAAMASLLAGSEMLNETASHTPEGDKTSSWHGYVFSLGWWDLPGGGQRFGIDVGKANEERYHA